MNSTPYDGSRNAVAAQLARLAEARDLKDSNIDTTGSTRTTLADVEHVFGNWLPDDDVIPTRAVLAAYMAHQIEGDPVWLMLVGGSGIGKTERMVPLSIMPDVVMASSITGPAALLSGTKKIERSKNSTGGLLRTLPNGQGVLVLKDFTSVLDMHRDARAEVLAALREVFDGRWDRSVGTDGGQTLTWTGRVGIIAGCTTAIDAAHAVIASMGTRFVLCRVHPAKDVAESALDHVGRETEMRDELRRVVAAFLRDARHPVHLVAVARQQLAALSSYVARARSPVDRDQQGEIRLVMDPEAPTRLAKMLGKIWQACGVLGLDHAASWAVVSRIGFDSIPKLRREVLDHLAVESKPRSTSAVAEAVAHPSRTTRRALEDLTAHGAVCRHGGGDGKTDMWILAEPMATWLSGIRTLPGMSGAKDLSAVPSNKHTHSLDDKTGKVAGM